MINYYKRAIRVQHIKNQILLPYTPQQLFDLVNDTESYSHFVPYCTKGQVLEEHSWGKIASLSFGSMGFETTLTTKNILLNPQSIQITLLSGPLKSLHGLWSFETSGSQTEVTLSLDYELSSSWAHQIFSPLLEEMMKRMCDIFIQEAKKRYE